jgi:parallel beta-helix repeat protein
MRIVNILRVAAAVVAAALFAGTAHAQLFRAYLSPTGNDASPCTLPAPCRLLPAALTAVADGGEIWMLGSANYNTATVSIAKSVSILAVPGVVGSVVATGGPAISIATAGVNVSLRNLVITPLPGAGGTAGIVMTSGSGLTINGLQISGLAGNGVDVRAAARVRIQDTTIQNVNQGTSGTGAAAVYLSGGATGEISGTKILGNYFGVEVDGNAAAVTSSVTISDSILEGSANSAVFPWSTVAGSTARAFITRSTVTNNNGGIVPQGSTAIATVSNCTVHGNTYGFFNIGATLRTFGNNNVSDNGTSVTGTVTTVAPI